MNHIAGWCEGVCPQRDNLRRPFLEYSSNDFILFYAFFDALAFSDLNFGFSCNLGCELRRGVGVR